MAVDSDGLDVWRSPDCRLRGDRSLPEGTCSSASAKRSTWPGALPVSTTFLVPRLDKNTVMLALLASCVAIGLLGQFHAVSVVTRRCLGDSLEGQGKACFPRSVHWRMPPEDANATSRTLIDTNRIVHPVNAAADTRMLLAASESYGGAAPLGMKMPTVTIAAPCLGRDILSRRADLFLDSISKQTVLPLELILVISNATEGLCARQVATARQQLPSSVRVTSNCSASRINQAEARNFASALAKGDLVMFSDADDPMHRERVEIVSAIFQGRGNLRVFSHSYTNSMAGLSPSLMMAGQRIVPSADGTGRGNHSTARTSNGIAHHANVALLSSPNPPAGNNTTRDMGGLPLLGGRRASDSTAPPSPPESSSSLRVRVDYGIGTEEVNLNAKVDWTQNPRPKIPDSQIPNPKSQNLDRRGGRP